MDGRTEAKVRGSSISSLVTRFLGRFQADTAEVAERLYLFEQPLLVSHQSFEDAFGAHPTPHEEALGRARDWHRRRPRYHI